MTHYTIVSDDCILPLTSPTTDLAAAVSQADALSEKYYGRIRVVECDEDGEATTAEDDGFVVAYTGWPWRANAAPGGDSSTTP